MIRILPAIVEVALLVFCLVDIIQTPEFACRNLSKGWWLVLVIVVPLVGCVAWLVAGRPEREHPARPWQPGSGFPEHGRPPADTAQIDRGLQEHLDRIDREFDESVRRRRERDPEA